MDMDTDNNPHIGHRSRMRERFAAERSLDGFHDHEILEMILYFSIKRADTNKLAHRLLDKYGSLAALFDAPISNIMKKGGVSENTAFLLALLPHIAKRYNESKVSEYSDIRSKSDVYNILIPYVFKGKNEGFYVICMGIDYRVIDVVKVSDGGANNTTIRLNRLVEIVLRHGSLFAIVAHNHPCETCKPSQADVDSTAKIKRVLESVNVALVDHIIVCGDKCYSFAQNNVCDLKY